MDFIWNQPIEVWLVTMLIIIGVFGFCFFMYFKIVKRRAGYIFISIAFVLTFVSFLFNLYYAYILMTVLTSVGVTISLFANLGDLRAFLANPFKKSQTRSGKFEVEKIYNR